MESNQQESGMGPGRSTDLEKAYTATNYRIILWNLILNVEETHPALDEKLISIGQTDWAFITACNPKSEPLPLEENHQRMMALRHYLGERAFYDAVGEPVTDDWEPEPSLFLPGMNVIEAKAVGRLFGQWAVLTGRIGQQARLSWCFEEELLTQNSLHK